MGIPGWFGVRALQLPLRMLDAQGVVTGPRHVDRLPVKLGPGHQGAAIPDRGQTGLRLDPVKALQLLLQF